jgi:hypothetical protein
MDRSPAGEDVYREGVGGGNQLERDLRPLRRFALSITVLSALTAIVVTVAGAKPATHGVRVSTTYTDDVTTNFLRGPVDAGEFLPQPDCPFAPADRASLTARVHGSEESVSQPGLAGQAVKLHARVEGTLTDVDGRSYHVSGSFLQSGATRFPIEQVPFDGTGELTIAGDGGSIVSGQAAFRIVQDFPLEWDFWLTRVDRCTVR